MLQPDEVIDNATLCRLFRVANTGGMRRSLAQNHLVLVADWTRTGGVQNRWDGDVLHFVGQGAGDQQLKGQNRTLARSAVTGETLHLFEVREPGRYLYRGRASLAGEPYEQQQPDADGNSRRVIVFPLRLRPHGDQSSRPGLDEEQRPPAAPYLPVGVYAVISARIAPERLADVNQKLDELRALGVAVTDQRDVDDARHTWALSRWHEQVIEDLRRAARRVVEEARRRCGQAGKPWTFVPDEVEIDDFADEDRVKQVLDNIGRADEFDRFRDDAFRHTPMPSPPEHLDDPGPLAEEEFAELQRQVAARGARRF